MVEGTFKMRASVCARCDFPQKEQQSVWFSRLSTHASDFVSARTVLSRPNLTLLGCRSWLLDHHFVDQAVLLRLTRPHEVVAISVLLDAVERLAGVLHQ